MQMKDSNVPNVEASNVNVGIANASNANMALIVRTTMEVLENVPALQKGEPNEQGRATLLYNFQKLNPPTFNGDSNPRAAMSWLQRMEKFLDTIDDSTGSGQSGLDHFSVGRGGRPMVEICQEHLANEELDVGRI